MNKIPVSLSTSICRGASEADTVVPLGWCVGVEQRTQNLDTVDVPRMPVSIVPDDGVRETQSLERGEAPRGDMYAPMHSPASEDARTLNVVKAPESGRKPTVITLILSTCRGSSRPLTVYWLLTANVPVVWVP